MPGSCVKAPILATRCFIPLAQSSFGGLKADWAVAAEILKTAEGNIIGSRLLAGPSPSGKVRFEQKKNTVASLAACPFF